MADTLDEIPDLVDFGVVPNTSFAGADLLGRLDTNYSARQSNIGPSLYDYGKAFASGAGSAIVNLPSSVYEFGKAALPYAEYLIPVYGQYRAGQDLGTALKSAEADRALKEQTATEYYTPIAKKATEIGVRGGAQIAGGLGGAAVGGLAGIETGPGAVLTSILGAGTGASAADVAAKQLLEYLGISEPTSGLSKAEGAGETFALGGVGEAIPAIISAGSKVPQALEDIGLASQRKALGARFSDYKKGRIVTDELGDVGSQTKAALNKVIRDETLGSSSDPVELWTNLKIAQNELRTSIDDVVKSVDQSGVKIDPPNFDSTKALIDNKKLPVDRLSFYKRKIQQVEKAFEDQPTLEFINNQKKAYSERWKDNKSADAGFWRSFYMDLKNSVDTQAPEIAALNKEKQVLEIVEPIIQRNVVMPESGSPLATAGKLFDTTGGGGMGAGGALGRALGSEALGVTAGLSAKALASRGGLNVVGTGLRNAGELLGALTNKGIGSTADALALPSVVGANLLAQESKPTQTESIDWAKQLEANPSLLDQIPDLLGSDATELAKPEETPTVKVGKQNISIPVGEEFAPADLVKAVIRVESAGKKDAVSSKGARGLMQLMPGTAKQMGVRNSFDPQQNIEGGSKYLNIQLNEFEDPKLALAAYNWGPANVKKYIRFLEQQGIDPTWENIVANYSPPAETRNYVKKVMSFYA